MKFTKMILTAALGCTLSAGVFAASPDWNFVEGGYTQMDVDGLRDDQKGFNFGGSYRFNEDFFARGRYTIVDESIAGVDIDTDWGEVGLGYIHGVNSTTDVYGVVALEYLKVDTNAGGDSDTGYSVHAGVKSRIAEQVELFGELGYADIDDADISDLSLRAGANYYFTDNLSVGADYRKLDDIDLLSATVRYSF